MIKDVIMRKIPPTQGRGETSWCHFENYLAAVFERYLAEPGQVPLTWRAADPLEVAGLVETVFRPR